MADYAEMHAFTPTGDRPRLETAIQERVTPTFFIGLGGSGKAVLMWLRKRFHDHHLRIPGYIQFLFLDTDKQTKQPEGMSDEDFSAVQPQQGELIFCGIDSSKFNSTFDKVAAEVAEARPLAWLEPKMRDAGWTAVQDGVGTHRQFGRLAFYLYADQIRQAVDNRIARVLALEGKDRNAADTTRIEVVIVTSLAGGTGAGMFLDVAYLVHALLGSRTLESKYRTIMAFMPSLWADRKDLLPGLQQNAYAALLELEYYGTPRSADDLLLGRVAANEGTALERSNGFPTPWHPDSSIPFIAGPAWGDCYLIDSLNDLESNRPLAREEVYRMTADFLFLDFENDEFAKRKRSMRSNLVKFKEQLFGTTVRSRTPRKGDKMRESDVLYLTRTGCKYSAFGLAQIDFDVNRLYLAAGYRLASRLTRTRWIGRDDSVSSEAYQQWTEADLLGPKSPPASGGLSLRRWSLIHRLLARQASNWLDDAVKDIDQYESAEPVPGYDALNQALERHKEQIENPERPVQRTIAENLKALRGTSDDLGPLRQHLREKLLDRLSRLGAVPTLKLLETYQQTLKQISDRIVETSEEAGGEKSALGRLADALRVGVLGRNIALKIEYPRAFDAVREEVQLCYQRVATPAAVELIAAMADYAGHRPDKKGLPDDLKKKHGTLFGLCAEARAYLDKVADELDIRYKQYSAPVEQKNLRRQSLSPGWSDPTYDDQINQALLSHTKVGASPTDAAKFDWEKLESLVVERLIRAESHPGLRRLADYLDFWIQNRKNTDGYSHVVEHLAAICREIVREGGLNLRDVADGNAVDLLWSQDNRAAMVEQLVLSSAPYLQTEGHPTIGGHDLALNNLFGYKRGDHAATDPAQNNHNLLKALVHEMILANTKEQSDAARGMEAEQIGSGSSMVLVREMAGFPLLFYKGIGELQRAYERTRQPPTGTKNQCHIDRRLATGDMPYIRPLELATNVHIRDNIGLVFRGMMLGWLAWEDEQFQIELSDPHGHPYMQPMGTQLHPVIRFACESESIRDQLKEHWSQWSSGARTEQWACLYASALMTYRIAHADITSARKAEPESTPLRNCFSDLVADLQGRLKERPDGQPWLAAIDPKFKGHDSSDDGAPRGSQYLDDLIKQTTVRVRADLSIFRLLPDKVKHVTLPSPSATPEAASS
jgi:hypothetical protein